jgi:hypothetical protein
LAGLDSAILERQPMHVPDTQDNIDRTCADGIFAEFRKYVCGFYGKNEDSDSAIRMKEKHSERVAAECIDLAASLDLEQHDIRIAGIIGILHDIGRFPQFARYGNYIDGRSGNHGKLGASVISETGILSCISPKHRDIIINTVSMHNRHAIPENITGCELTFLKLIRDADKIDILKVVTEHYTGKNREKAIQIELPETGIISQKILDAVLSKKNAGYSDVRSIDDLKLMQIGWVYDFNFPRTCRIVKERNYLEIICSQLPDFPGVNTACESAMAHLTSRASS